MAVVQMKVVFWVSI